MSALVCAGPTVHKHQYSSGHAVTDINLDNVCKKGNTLLWDLVQDEDAVGSRRRTSSLRPSCTWCRSDPSVNHLTGPVSLIPLCFQIHLSEGLINEAEKLLCSLVCWFTDRQIRMRFIEGCLDNLAHHR